MKSQRVACRTNVETGKKGEEKGGGLERKEKGRRFFSLFPFSFIAPPPPLFTPATQVKQRDTTLPCNIICRSLYTSYS